MHGAYLARLPSCLLLLGVMLSLGCALGQPKPQTAAIIIHQLVIVNTTALPIKNVRVNALNSGKFFGCSYIPPKRECSIEFRTIESRQQPATLSWVEDQTPYTLPLSAKPLSTYDGQQPLTIVVQLLKDGRLAASYRP